MAHQRTLEPQSCPCMEAIPAAILQSRTSFRTHIRNCHRGMQQLMQPCLSYSNNCSSFHLQDLQLIYLDLAGVRQQESYRSTKIVFPPHPPFASSHVSVSSETRGLACSDRFSSRQSVGIEVGLLADRDGSSAGANLACFSVKVL